MIQGMFDKGSIPVLEQILYFTTERQRAIASNIANVNTPNYRALDAPEEEFKKALFEAIEERDQSPVPVFRFEGTSRIRPKEGGGLEVDLIEPLDAGTLTHQNNNVDIESEMAKMVKNSGLHNLVAGLLSMQFNLMRSAINERIMG